MCTQTKYYFYRQSAPVTCPTALWSPQAYSITTAQLLTEICCYLETFIKYIKTSLNLTVLLSIPAGYFQIFRTIPAEPTRPVLTSDIPNKQANKQTNTNSRVLKIRAFPQILNKFPAFYVKCQFIPLCTTLLNLSHALGDLTSGP